MLKDTDYKLAHSHETYYKALPLGVRIFIANGRDELTKEEDTAVFNLGEDIFKAVWRASAKEDKESIASGAKQKAEILALFGDKRIFVQEIPNGYCSDPCCINLPWFLVTTDIGPIEIGWRKRVMSINWAQTSQKKTAEELFPTENTTRYNQLIHAWNVEDAKRYLDVIHTLVVPTKA